MPRAGFKGVPGSPKPPTNRGPRYPTKPFIFYLSVMMPQRLRLSCRALFITVLARRNFYSAGWSQASHQLNPPCVCHSIIIIGGCLFFCVFFIDLQLRLSECSFVGVYQSFRTSKFKSVSDRQDVDAFMCSVLHIWIYITNLYLYLVIFLPGCV